MHHHHHASASTVGGKAICTVAGRAPTAVSAARHNTGPSTRGTALRPSNEAMNRLLLVASVWCGGLLGVVAVTVGDDFGVVVAVTVGDDFGVVVVVTVVWWCFWCGGGCYCSVVVFWCGVMVVWCGVVSEAVVVDVSC